MRRSCSCCRASGRSWQWLIDRSSVERPNSRCSAHRSLIFWGGDGCCIFWHCRGESGRQQRKAAEVAGSSIQQKVSRQAKATLRPVDGSLNIRRSWRWWRNLAERQTTRVCRRPVGRHRQKCRLPPTSVSASAGRRWHRYSRGGSVTASSSPSRISFPHALLPGAVWGAFFRSFRTECGPFAR